MPPKLPSAQNINRPTPSAQGMVRLDLPNQQQAAGVMGLEPARVDAGRAESVVSDVLGAQAERLDRQKQKEMQEWEEHNRVTLQRQKTEAAAMNKMQLAQSKSNWEKSRIQIMSDLKRDPDYSSYGKKYSEATEKVRQEAAKNILDPRLRDAFLLDTETDLLRDRIALDNRAYQLKANDAVTNTNTSNAEAISMLGEITGFGELDVANQQQKIINAEVAKIESNYEAGYITKEEAVTQKKNFRNDAEIARMNALPLDQRREFVENSTVFSDEDKEMHIKNVAKDIKDAPKIAEAERLNYAIQKFPEAYQKVVSGDMTYPEALNLYNNEDTRAMGLYALNSLNPVEKAKKEGKAMSFSREQKAAIRAGFDERWRKLIDDARDSQLEEGNIDAPFREVVQFYNDVIEDPALTQGDIDKYITALGPVLEDKLSKNWRGKRDIDKDPLVKGYDDVIARLEILPAQFNTNVNKAALFDNVIQLSKNKKYDDGTGEMKLIEEIAFPDARQKAIGKLSRDAYDMWMREKYPQFAGMDELPNAVIPKTGEDGGGDTGLPQITNDAEYESLPSGTKFKDPDGNTRIKP